MPEDKRQEPEKQQKSDFPDRGSRKALGQNRLASLENLGDNMSEAEFKSESSP